MKYTNKNEEFQVFEKCGRGNVSDEYVIIVKDVLQIKGSGSLFLKNRGFVLLLVIECRKYLTEIPNIWLKFLYHNITKFVNFL